MEGEVEEGVAHANEGMEEMSQKIGYGLVYVGAAIALVLLGVGFSVLRDRMAQQPQVEIQMPPAQKPAELPPVAPALEKKAEEAAKWPEKARFAVISRDGSTVALMEGRSIRVYRGAKEIYRNDAVNHLHPQMRLSQDGSDLEVHVLWRRGTATFDVETGKEIGFVQGRPEWAGGSGAVCSDDGRTVALVKGGTLTIRREGRLLSTAGALGKMLLNRDGSRLLGYDKAKKAVVLLETETGKEKRVHAVKDETADFHFSLGGGAYGVVEAGATELQLWHAYDGTQREKLAAEYSFQLSGRTVKIHYELRGFWFDGVEPTDNEMTVTLLARAKKGPYDSEMKPSEDSRVTWGVQDGYWYNLQRVYGCLDQGYHFRTDGSLSEAGKRGH